MKKRKIISAFMCICLICLTTALPMGASAETTSGTMANGEGVADAIK